MAQVKLTKNELKKEKDALKRFQRYLPTLQLKKQQLQMVLRQIEAELRVKHEERDKIKRSIDVWIKVFGEDIDLSQYIKVKEIKTSLGNIAGIDIPVFENLELDYPDYDLFAMPLWVDKAIEAMAEMLKAEAIIRVLEEQQRLVAQELRITSQRVNLFEKVKIPETKENIRKIQIYLGDQQTAAVVRGKIAKNNLVKGEA